jgi:hypothetical protein
VPLGNNDLAGLGRWGRRHWTVDLPYRDDLPTAERAAAERDRWLAEEQGARQAGDEAKARDSRALAERMTRWLGRLPGLPPGRSFPLPVTLWRMGGSFWVAVEAEHYQLLQRRLRERFPAVAVVVATLANGARATYLPPREAYAKGIYQETVAVLAPGCLEAVIDAVVGQIQDWL